MYTGFCLKMIINGIGSLINILDLKYDFIIFSSISAVLIHVLKLKEGKLNNYIYSISS